MNIIYRRKYGTAVLGKIMRWFHEREGLFETKHIASAPQNTNVPLGVTRGSHEHLVFLYFITSIMYRDESARTFRGICDLWKKYPEVFTKNMPDKETLSGLIKGVGLGYHNDKARNWHGCGETLYGEFRGDPREMFSFKSVDAFVAWKKKRRNNGRAFLPGFGPKTYSLLNLFFAEVGAVSEMVDAIPVDRHIMRQFLSWKIVEGNGVHDAASVMAEKIRKELAVFCKTHGERPANISHALWLLGTHLCRHCPQIKGIEHLCPAHEICGGKVHIALYQKRGQWNMDDQKIDARHPQTAFPFDVGAFLRK